VCGEFYYNISYPGLELPSKFEENAKEKKAIDKPKNSKLKNQPF